MEYFLTGKATKEVDRYCIEKTGIPSVVLMERAACAVAEEADRDFESYIQNKHARKQAEVICGTGNNGADGLAAARILSQMGYECRICILGDIDRATQEFCVQYKIVTNMGLDISVCNCLREVQEYTLTDNAVIIDAIFGIGLSRDVGGMYLEMICKINHAGNRVVAADIASGLDSSCGKMMGAAVKADITVTFGKAKTGHFLCEGREYSGRIIVRDVGFIQEAYDKVMQKFPEQVLEGLTQEDISMIPARKRTSHKGTYCNVNIVGARGYMSGAAALAGMAAYACGAGIVKIYAKKCNTEVIRTILKEAIVNDASCFDEEEKKTDRDIIVVGPGLGKSEKALELVKKVLATGTKIIIDADALNLISMNKILLEELNDNIVITPHIKEMSRLTDKSPEEIRENIVDCAREFSLQYGCTTVIKDATTVISSPDGKIRINTTGNSGMSKGGSGDVLSGIIGGLISQGMPVYEAACLGVYIHGMAGDMAAELKSEYSLLASDIIEAVPKVLKLKNDSN